MPPTQQLRPVDLAAAQLLIDLAVTLSERLGRGEPLTSSERILYARILDQSARQSADALGLHVVGRYTDDPPDARPHRP